MAKDTQGNMIYGEGQGLFKEGSPYLDMVKGTYTEKPSGGIVGPVMNPNPNPATSVSGATPAPLTVTNTAPTDAANKYWNGGQAATPEQLATAQAWAKGKTSEQIAAKGQEMNLSPDQFASVFGEVGPAATNVGYGADSGLIASARGLTWDGTQWVPTASADTPTGKPAGDTPVTAPAPVNLAPNAPATYTPERVSMTPEMTVENRISNLIDPNNPLNQQITANTKQAFAGRGLVNSSMAGSAAQDAIIRNAQGIATTDAGTASNIALANQQAGNQAGQFNASAQNVLNQMSVQQQNDLAKMAQAQGYNLQSMNAQQILDLQKMDAAQKNNLQTLSTQFGFDLQKMDKATASTLSQMSVQQQNDIAKMAVAQGYNLQNMTAQQVNDLQKMSTAQTFLKENMGTQQTFDLAKMDKAAATTLAQMDQQQLNNLATMAKQHGYNLETLTAQQAGALANIGAQASVSERLAALNIDAQKALNLDNQTFQKALTSSAQMQGILGNLQTQIAAAQRDPNITDPAAKQAIVTDLANIARASLSVVGNASTDVDVTSLMNQLFPK